MPIGWCGVKRRLEALERGAASSQEKKDRNKRRGFWDVVETLMPMLGPLVSGAALAWVGYMLTGALEAGFKSQELHLSEAKEMRDQLARFHADKITSDDARGTALTLSIYGRPAISPLLTVLIGPDPDVRLPAAEDGLRAISLAYPDDLCKALVGILRNRAGHIPWPAYAAAVRLAGDASCKSAEPALTALADRLANATPLNVAELAKDFADNPPLARGGIRELQADLTKTLRALHLP
jgi:hypothetical protein